MSLLDDIKTAEGGRWPEDRPCGLCDVIRDLADDGTREAFRGAAAGTISERALHKICRKHGFGIGFATIKRHRSEEHQ